MSHYSIRKVTLFGFFSDHTANSEQLLTNAVAATVTCICAIVGTAIIVIATAEPEHEKDDDNPAAVTAIAKVKSTVHKDFSFK